MTSTAVARTASVIATTSAVAAAAASTPAVNTYFCYLLRSLSTTAKGCCYIGFTNNPIKRLRQHNGLIGAGAKKTSRKRPWEMIMTVYGFPSKVTALQFEWAWQWPTTSRLIKHRLAGRKYPAGAIGRVCILYEMLCTPPFCHYPLHVHYPSEERYKEMHDRAWKLIHKVQKPDDDTPITALSTTTARPQHLPLHMTVVSDELTTIPALAKKIKVKKARKQKKGCVEVANSADEDIAAFDDDSNSSGDDEDASDDGDEVTDTADVTYVEDDDGIIDLTQPRAPAISQADKLNGSAAHKRSTSDMNKAPTNKARQQSSSPLEPASTHICTTCHLCGESVTPIQYNESNALNNLTWLSSSMTACYHDCSFTAHVSCLSQYFNHCHSDASTQWQTLPQSMQYGPRAAPSAGGKLKPAALLPPATASCPKCHDQLHWALCIEHAFKLSPALKLQIEQHQQARFNEAREVYADNQIDRAIEKERKQKDKERKERERDERKASKRRKKGLDGSPGSASESIASSSGDDS